MADYKKLLEQKKAEVLKFYQGDHEKANKLIARAEANGQAVYDSGEPKSDLEQHVLSSLQGLLRLAEAGGNPFE